ncbi:esterase [Aeromicrobium camelliae]|uniref:Esterase n=1 Tax=Aeromicrobium camelliae TaxID=1538144 RepID=A0A3N6WWB2_9ACTN|nr:patatin-like phospholipase family protein [Aeromicrobium camelliae]RQN09292.1 esterase [Aeromicrobium camelliae]
MSEGRRVALSLGSGGARGYAHIGVIEELRERGYEIVTIAGTSMGALVGGLTAAGRIDDFAEWARGLRQRDVLRLFDLRISGPGAIAAERLFARMAEFFEGAAIEDLPIPFTAVATDLGSRREVWFQQGPLQAAVRASIAIPGLFSPVMINGRLLVDGGLTNPVPLEPTTAVPADLTLAVSLLAPRHRRELTSPVHTSSAPDRSVAWRERLVRTLAALTGRDSDPVDDEQHDLGDEVAVDPHPSSPTDALPPGLRKVDVTALSFETIQSALARYRMAGLPADIVIDVPVDACKTLDFHRAEAMIDLGRSLAAEALDQFEAQQRALQLDEPEPA